MRGASTVPAELWEALGETVSYHAMPWNQYRALAFPGADDLGKTLSQWLEVNGGSIPGHQPTYGDVK